MKKSMLFLSLTLLIAACGQHTNIKQNNMSESKTKSVYEVNKLVSNFKSTEGPAVDPEGNVFFSDLGQSMIFIWKTTGQLDTFRINSGRSNGLYFDKDGKLLACEMEKGFITSTSPNGDYIIIPAIDEGIRYNEPNDLWADDKGGIYFTDPKYGRNDNELSQDGMYVYYISPDYSKTTRVIDDFEKPNGLAGTLDGKILYITDAQAEKTYRYSIQEDGSLTNKSLFVDLGCDGMTIDRLGNVYLTTRGKNAVDIFSPAGKLLDSIEVPEKPTNVCFGGKDRNQLFITARTSLYSVNLDFTDFE